MIPSLIAYFLIGLLIFHWLRKYLKTTVAFLAGLLIMTSVFMVATARLSTPDNLSAFFLLAAFYFILERPNTWLMFLFLVLSIFTRADNVIISFFIISFLAFTNKWEKKIQLLQYFAMSLILIAVYIIVIFPVTEFGWDLFYYSGYARHMDFNRDFDKALTWSDYLSYMYSKAITGLVSSHFTFFMFLTALIVFIPFQKKVGLLSFDQMLALVLAVVILIRFILLPDLSDRFYIAFYLCTLIILTRRMVQKFATYQVKL